MGLAGPGDNLRNPAGRLGEPGGPGDVGVERLERIERDIDYQVRQIFFQTFR